jgi:hypothetical protein
MIKGIITATAQIDWEKSMKIISQDSLYPGRDSNLLHPQYNSGLLSLDPDCSVTHIYFLYLIARYTSHCMYSEHFSLTFVNINIAELHFSDNHQFTALDKTCLQYTGVTIYSYLPSFCFCLVWWQFCFEAGRPWKHCKIIDANNRYWGLSRLNKSGNVYSNFVSITIMLKRWNI